jgi:hypothetical protein
VPLPRRGAKTLLLTCRRGGRVKKPSFCPDFGNLWSKYAPNSVLTVKGDGFDGWYYLADLKIAQPFKAGWLAHG